MPAPLPARLEPASLESDPSSPPAISQYPSSVGIAFRFASLLLVLCSALPGFQSPDPASVESIREKDVYAIYSLVLAKPNTSRGAHPDERYAIAATTRPAYPREQQPCVRPPKEREEDFRGVLTEYERSRSTTRELKSKFSLPKPYALLSASEVDQFLKQRSSPRIGETAEPTLPDATFLFQLTDVYFNPDRTLAMTGISGLCGGLCGFFEWTVFEKLNTGKWERRNWVTCSTIY